MKNVLKKCLILICIIALIITIFTEKSWAHQLAKPNASHFSGTLSGDGTDNAIGSIDSIIGTVLSIVRNIGVAIAIIMLIVLACKYMLASAGDRADIKKYIPTYILGAIILFAASGIISIIKSYVDDSFKK